MALKFVTNVTDVTDVANRHSSLTFNTQLFIDFVCLQQSVKLYNVPNNTMQSTHLILDTLVRMFMKLSATFLENNVTRISVT